MVFGQPSKGRGEGGRGEEGGEEEAADLRKVGAMRLITVALSLVVRPS